MIYHYDFGDDWVVEITRLEDSNDLLAAGRLTPQALATAEKTVSTAHRPVCLAKDGINLMDDVGGLYGFIEFLKTVYEDPNIAESEEMFAWASGQGWNRRKVALPNEL